MRKKELKDIDAQLKYEELRDFLSDNFSDTIDFMRDYADSFSLICDYMENEDPNGSLLLAEFPYYDLKSSLMGEEKISNNSVKLKFELNDVSAEWLKKQGFSNIYVPCISHPINDRKMMVLTLLKDNEEVIGLDDGVFDILKYKDDQKFITRLSDYLKKHCSFYKFAQSIENDSNSLCSSETIIKYAVANYPDLFFMQQFSDVSNKHLPELYSENVVEFCAKVMIERHKIKNDEFLFSDLFLWLNMSLMISVGWGKTEKNPATAGWQIVRNYIIMQDKNLVCNTICKIINNSLSNHDHMYSYNALLYNCVSIFMDIGKPYSNINDEKVERILKYFEQYELKKNYYLDKGAKKMFGNELLEICQK